MTTQETIAAVNTHTDLLNALDAANLPLPNPGDRRPEAVAFRVSVAAYSAAVDEMDAWPLDDSNVFTTPDGLRVAYLVTYCTTGTRKGQSRERLQAIAE